MWSNKVEQGGSFSIYAEFELSKPRRSRSDVQLFLIHCANKQEVWSHPGVRKFIERDLQRKTSEETQPMRVVGLVGPSGRPTRDGSSDS